MARYKRFGISLICLILCLLTLLLAAIPAQAEDSSAAEVSVQYVAVYKSASYQSLQIGLLECGTVLNVLDASGKFYKIDCYDMIGYIPEEFVSFRNSQYVVRSNLSENATISRLSRPLTDTVTFRCRLYSIAVAQKGVPYVSGGTTPRGFDCSGFTQYVYRQCGIEIPRSCDTQVSEGIIIPKEALACGDLVFFQGTNGYAPLASHVGIYLGDGLLIHAGSKGITIVELDSYYFTKHYQCARRIVPSQQANLSWFADVMAAYTEPPKTIRNMNLPESLPRCILP